MKNKQIELNKKQYKQLIQGLETGAAVFGLLGDFVSKKYKRESNKLEELQSYLLSYAKEFRCGRMVEEFEGKIILRDKLGEKFMKITEDYDDFIFWNKLINLMAWKDFVKEYGVKRVKKMDTGERIMGSGEFEDKYREEFNKNGIDKLEVKK